MTGVRLVLPPQPASAGAGRSVVSSACEAAGAERCETAVLLASELITNALVHARSELELVVACWPHGLRVEVRDRDPHLPSVRQYDHDATTGRGLALVQALADGHGAEPWGAGKRVWFTLGTPPPVDDGEAPGSDSRSTATHDVQLAGLPLALYDVWQQHADALLREALLTGLHDDSAAVLSADEHARALRAFALVSETVARSHAAGRGQAAVDAVLVVPHDDVLAFSVLRQGLARAGTAAAAGRLLTPPALPELVALRDWVCDQVLSQADGLPPRPWRLPVAVHTGQRGVRAACQRVRESAEAELLSDEHNVLLAVSPAAERLLGWPAGHLEGARTTTVVPGTMVEAHLAAFSRLLVTGQPRVLGEELRLPARRRDDTSVEVTVLLSQQVEPDGRLFHALLRPR